MPLRRIAWVLLGTLLGATLIGAAFYDRSAWSGRMAGESTYLMQAASLADDFDLTYTRTDFDRMLLADLGNPTDLSLVSSTGGRRISYDRPFPYALYLAPFVKIWPRQGFAIANALLLALAAVAATRTLERRIGAWAPAWVTVLIFASVLFAYVFLATGDLFLFAVTVLAFCLVAGAAEETRQRTRASARRWLAVGALLAIPAATEPLYAVLFAAAFFAPVGEDRGAARGALALGFLAALAIQLGVGAWAGGGLHLLGASHFRFTPETGFPLVDFTAAEWDQTVRRLSALHWDGAARFSWGLDPRLWAWDGLYLLAGRSIGLLPYFAPLLLLLVGREASGWRRPLALAAAAWAVGVVILQPFNLYGGEGAVANRLFLPIYGALWLLASAPRKRRILVLSLAPVIVAAVAAPFLWRLWSSPWSEPIDAGEGYRHVTPAARALLPYENSQRWMPGGPASEHNGLMVKFLSENAWAETRRGRLVIDGDKPAELLVGSLLPLDMMRLDFGKDAPSKMLIGGGELEESILLPSGGISFRVVPTGWTPKHPMWWTPRPQWLYRFTVTLPGATDRALGFQMYGERFEDR